MTPFITAFILVCLVAIFYLVCWLIAKTAHALMDTKFLRYMVVTQWAPMRPVLWCKRCNKPMRPCGHGIASQWDHWDGSQSCSDGERIAHP